MSGFQRAEAQAHRYEAATRVFMDGSAEILASTAGLRPGDAVLDLACGTGLVARHARPRVGPTGRVVGTDINPAMLSVARAVVSEDVEWVQAPADDQPFPENSFDHVLCQQGVQFFPDPVAAMVEARRVLKPSGRLSATVWATPGRNPYIEHQLELLALLDATIVGSLQAATPPDADVSMSTWAGEAGFSVVRVDTIEHVVPIARLGDFFVEQTTSTPWGPVLARLDEDERRDVVDEMCGGLEAFLGDDGVHHVPFVSFRLVASTV